MTKKLLILLLLSIFIVSGCIIQLGTGGKETSIKGIFKSSDKGNSWAIKNLFLYSGGTGSINGVEVLDLVFDPQDNKAIYLASANSGLIYSYDGAESWMKANGVDGRVEAVAIDPKNKCVIYASLANTIIKSTDCSRNWSEVYIDTRADKLITALAVDHYDNLTVYAGNSAGDILKSVDGGSRWQVVERLGDKIARILISPADSRIIYIATSRKGIFKTANSGVSWTEINDGLKPYSGAFEYRKLIFDPSQNDSLLLVSKYGLIRTMDGGKTWRPIELITPPTTTDIFSVAINPKDNKEIYYATASTFYKTVDSGQNWITKRLPSLAIPSVLMIDPQNSTVIYMGMTSPAKK